MGADRPKLRIWVTMSTGSDVERDAGILAGQHLAQLLDVGLGGMVIGGSTAPGCRRRTGRRARRWSRKDSATE